MINPEYDKRKQEEWLAAVKANPSVSVNTPGPYDLYLDLDTESAFLGLPARMGMLYEKMGLVAEVAHVLPSSSGLPHRHVYLKMADPIESGPVRYAIQMALGSDPVKEILSIDRNANGLTPECVLVEGNWKGKI